MLREASQLVIEAPRASRKPRRGGKSDPLGAIAAGRAALAADRHAQPCIDGIREERPLTCCFVVELIRRYSNRPDLLYDLETLMSSLRRVAEAGGTPERLSVSSSGRLGRQWALSERLTEDQEHKIVEAFLAGASKPQLGREFGISPKSVQRVLRRHGARRLTPL